MSTRLILSIALLATIQCAHAETFMKHNNRDTVVANTLSGITYEQPRQQTDIMTQASYLSLTNAQRMAQDGLHITNKPDMFRAMLERMSERENLRPSAHMPFHSYTKLLLKQNTRSKLGRAVLKYKPSDRKHSLSKLDARRRLASII